MKCVTLKSTRSRSLNMAPVDRSYSRACVIMTSSEEVFFVSKQFVSGLQAQRSADKCLARCLYNDGVVQAVTFGYLMY